MSEFYMLLDDSIRKISRDYEISNLVNVQNVYDDNCYWNRLASFSFFNKLYDEHRYHFLYEIQGLSSQIHFGLASCFLLRIKISKVKGRPNIYNHRYTFMLESTIHGIYSYWNRVGLVLNTYLKRPKEIKRTYFSTVVTQLLIDYPALEKDKNYLWLVSINTALEELNRNEFAHNNSLIMQNFLPKNYNDADPVKFMELPEILLAHNKSIVDEIYNLVTLIETLEQIKL